MSARRGKAFEVEIHKLFRYKLRWTHRPPDSIPSRQPRFTATNPIDLYGVDARGVAVLIECKALDISRHKSLPFRRLISRAKFRKSGSFCSFKQWGALYRCSKTELAPVWIALNVYGQPGRDGNRGRAYLVSFRRMARLRREYRHKRKSWPIEELIDHPTTIELVKVAGRWDFPQDEKLRKRADNAT